MPALSRTASFWTAAAVAGLALWASGAPTVVYPLYARAWDLAPSTTTLIFAVYPLVLIPVLLLFGKGRFSSMMGDVAQGLKSFKKGIAEEEDAPSAKLTRDAAPHGGTVVDVSPAKDGDEVARP